MPKRRCLSSVQRTELWSRWKDGQSLAEIGRALSRNSSSVLRFLAKTGGIAPAPRRRSSRELSLEEREEVSRGLSGGLTIRAIAGQLRRSPSTISREVVRNGGREHYRATAADMAAWNNARRPKRCKLTCSGRLRRLVATKLRKDWSPEQVSGWLKLTFPNDESMQVSHETIYRSLFIQARGVLKKELVAHLRSQRSIRRSQKASLTGQHRGQIIDAVSISERPPEANDRAVPGHWEGDLIAGSRNSHIATIVERQTRFTLLVKVASKDTKTVVAALIRQIRELPSELKRSLTWDRGKEMAAHKCFTLATDVKVFFCDPQSPWQRGTNENTNRLLRQYFPKGTDLSPYSQSELNQVAQRLNTRPRKTLGFHTPADKLAEVLR